MRSAGLAPGSKGALAGPLAKAHVQTSRHTPHCVSAFYEKRFAFYEAARASFVVVQASGERRPVGHCTGTCALTCHCSQHGEDCRRGQPARCVYCALYVRCAGPPGVCLLCDCCATDCYATDPTCRLLRRRPYGNFILQKGVVGPDGKDLLP